MAIAGARKFCKKRAPRALVLVSIIDQMALNKVENGQFPLLTDQRKRRPVKSEAMP